MRYRRAGTLLVAVCTLLLVTALPAAAHNELKSSNPKAGATLDTVPQAVTLTFSEKLVPGQTNVSVAGPDGANVSGELKLDGVTVTVPVGITKPGLYVVAYHVVASDGDVTDKKFTFTLAPNAAPPVPPPAQVTTTPPPAPTTTVPPTTTTTTPPTTSTAPTAQPQTAASSSDSGTTWWPWLVIGLAVIAAAVALVIVRRRRSATETPSGDSES